MEIKKESAQKKLAATSQCARYLKAKKTAKSSSHRVPLLASLLDKARTSWSNFLDAVRFPTREQWVRYYQSRGQFTQGYQDVYGRRY